MTIEEFELEREQLLAWLHSHVSLIDEPLVTEMELINEQQWFNFELKELIEKYSERIKKAQMG